MSTIPRGWFLPFLAWIGVACSGDSTSPTPVAACADVTLSPGQSSVLDPSSSDGCIRFPTPGASGAEYLVVVVSTSAQVESGGLSGPYELDAGSSGAVASVVPSPALAAFRPREAAAEFHQRLREDEQRLARTPGALLSIGTAQSAAATAPPAPGSQRQFNVISSTTSPFTFTRVTATAKYVGRKVAIYLDDAAPANGYSQSDLDATGNLFDTQMYAIDSAAFGTESDIDGNGVVAVLLSPAINELSGDCNSTGSVILGFFYGLDLLPTQPHSNGGEVFYSLVPDPDNTTCTVPVDFARQFLEPTFIHEFQHMISFNQHVLIRGGDAEATWLNEGLSHFAEELGARKLPDAPGDPPHTRFSQFAIGDITNAYDYLSDEEDNFLIEPLGSLGRLPERGANWLFVRWLVDHFDTDTTGANITRALLSTSATGSANVEAVTSDQFATLVTQWQMANYLDDLSGFNDASGRLGYSSWRFRTTFGSLNTQDPGDFPSPYPLVPDTVSTVAYVHTGTLRGGSAHHLLVEQASSAPSLEVKLSNDGKAPLSASLDARFGIARLR
jgi:hypothetical protein